MLIVKSSNQTYYFYLAMKYHTQANQLSFSIGKVKIICNIEEDILKIKANINSHCHQKSQLSLIKMDSQNDTIQFWIKENSTKHKLTQKEMQGSFEIQQNDEDVRMSKTFNGRFQVAQNSIKDIQDKFNSTLEYEKIPKLQISKTNNMKQSTRRSSTPSSVNTCNQNEQKSYQGMIEKEIIQNTKLQLLNNVLQAKIQQREKELTELQQKLIDQQELIVQLADKLLQANDQKQEIFLEYDRILESTVYNMKNIPDYQKDRYENYQPTQMGESDRCEDPFEVDRSLQVNNGIKQNP